MIEDNPCADADCHPLPPEPTLNIALAAASPHNRTITLKPGEQRMAESNLEKGRKLRIEVLGKEHVERSFKNADEFSKPLQDLGTEIGWGVFWSREGLTLKQRSLLNLGILAVLNRHHELGVHVKGAINNGLTKDEIREALIHVACYAGFPATIDAFRTAGKVLDEMGVKD
jgi:4-carboxymuconolactone decarboxylase